MYEYLGTLISLIAGILAIRGNTWDDSKQHLRKVTITGWLTIFSIFAGAILSVSAIKESNRMEWVSVRPIFMSLNMLNNDLGYAVALETISENGNQEAFDILNDTEENYFNISIKNSCENFIKTLNNWRLETKPQIRSNLDYVEVMCERNEFLNNRKHFFSNTKRITKDMCLMYLQQPSCQIRNDSEFAKDAEEVFLSH